MLKKFKKLVWAILSLSLICNLFSCKNATENEKLENLVVTYVPSPLNVPSILEKENNIFNQKFADMGITCSYAKLDSGADQTIALASGDIQILNAVGGSSVILAAANGLDIKILSMYSKAPKAFMMFSNDDTINTPKDLIGKKIAGPMGTNLHELLVAYLKKDNIDIKEVDYVSMDIPSSVAALESGAIDVALVGGTATYKLEKAGKHKICDGDGLIAATILVCCTNDFYNKHKDIALKFKEIQKEIVDSIDNDFENAMDITSKSLGIDKDAVKEMYKMYDFNPNVTTNDKELLKTTETFLFDAKMIDKHVDTDKLFIE